MPCNVIVHQKEGHTHIAAVDAEQMLSTVGNEQLAETATEARRRLTPVVESSAQPAA